MKSRNSSIGQERAKLKLNDVEDSTLTDDPKNVLKNLNKVSGNDEHFEPETVKRKECYFFKKFENCKFGVNCNFLHPQGQRGFKVCFQFEKYGSCRYGSTCKFSHRPFQKARIDYGIKQFNASNGARQRNHVTNSFSPYPFLEEIRSLVNVMKDMVYRQTAFYLQTTSQGSQQDSTGWGLPPPLTSQAISILHPSQFQEW